MLIHAHTSLYKQTLEKNTHMRGFVISYLTYIWEAYNINKMHAHYYINIDQEIIVDLCK